MKRLLATAFAVTLLLTNMAYAAETPDLINNTVAMSLNNSVKTMFMSTTAQAVNKSATENVRDSKITEAFDCINQERLANGLAPLTYDNELAACAQTYSAYMAENDYFDHTSAKGETFQDRIFTSVPDVIAAAESIAFGFTSGKSVCAAWMNSSAHRANILSAEYTHVGIGFSRGDNSYWVADFGAY